MRVTSPLLRRTTLPALLSVGAVLAAAGGTVPTASAASTAAAGVGASAITAVGCLHPTTGTAAAARGARGHGPDTRPVSAAEQRRIAARTAQLLDRRSGERRLNSPTSIPVYVHVMEGRRHAGNVSDTRIRRQVAVLNTTYAGQDSDATDPALETPTGFAFRLAGINRFVNATWHRDGASTTYRAKTRQGGRNALNIWLVDFDALGVATFPWDYARRPRIDGIRVQYSSLPGGGIPGYDLGKTVTHETGHWLGLFHTFQGGCTPPGDGVADTPAQASPSEGCPEGRDSCPAPGTDPVHDYMDYSEDSCYFMFTPGQVVRMQQMWAAYRA